VKTTRTHALNIRRIVGGTLMLVCFGANVLAVIYVTREHKLIEDTISETTSDHGVAWARLCAVEMQSGGVAGLQRLIDAIGQSRGVRLAMVVGNSGRVVAATDPSQVGRVHRIDHDAIAEDQPSEAHHVEELGPSPTGFFHEEGHTFQFVFPIRNDGKDYGELILDVNTAWGNLQAKALALKGLALVFAVTLLIGLAAWALDWRLRKAVKALIAATRAIAKGERTFDVEVGTGDELDILGDSVKQLAEALQDTEERVAHWHRELESTIANRTAQLEESQQLLAEREKMAALGLMAAGIVHEIGNPLTAMSAIVQRIQLKANAALGEKCGVLVEQIDRISRIVDDMRQVARPVSARGYSTNVNETLRIAIKVTQYDPRSKMVKISTELANEVPRVSGNADRWQQVFINLIINALDAMPDGGQLTVSTSVSGELVIISFRDTGSGMTPDQIRNLYHPFFTTKASGGMGLGLSVCNSIVRSYGGDIAVTSQLGSGTEFRITLPPYEERPRSATYPKTGVHDDEVPDATFDPKLLHAPRKATP